MTTSDELRRWADYLRKWAADTPISQAKAQMLTRAAEFEEEARETDAKLTTTRPTLLPPPPRETHTTLSEQVSAQLGGPSPVYGSS
jgi:hypothetical protein